MAAQKPSQEDSRNNSNRRDETGSDFAYVKYANASVSNNTFRSSFPFPDRPKPYLAPSLYSNDLVYNQNVNNNNNFTSSSHRRPYNRSSRAGLNFRSADSTQKALNELTHKRHEAMEKRRASLLLIVLIMFALGVHYVTNTGVIGDERINLQDGEFKNTGNVEIKAVESSGTTETEGKDAATTPAPDEPIDEIIPEGKEFLQPIRYFASLSTPQRPNDANFFFHIPRSGGQTIKEIVGRCLGKTLASEVGVRDGHGQDPTLQTVEINDAKYVNVDTTSVDGLHRAATLGLAESSLSDMIASSYFHTASMLFDLEHKGRAFTLLRNPIARVVSTYYERTQGENADIDVSLEDYAQGNGIENNWMTRFLTNKVSNFSNIFGLYLL